MNETGTVDEEGLVAARTPFPGTPAIYRRIAIFGSIGIHAFLFAGYWVIQTSLAGECWPTNWWPPVLTIGSALLFARFAYRWIMRLDAQYGRGSGWELKQSLVKLPFERQRRR